MTTSSTRTRIMATTLCAALAAPPLALACGGFFCQLVPINQAGEQIIFHQNGNDVTAIVLIQYTGEAEEFSWVVPVPGVPELSTGSDALFQSLELATRPQFNLEIKGNDCPQPVFLGGGGTGSPTAANESADDADGGVEILDKGIVGPFETQVVSSDDPTAMATWLEDNGYDLTDRGAELITPYVEDGMNFVALKLQQDRGVGDIRPLIMKYQTELPMIPIRLTAVAAQDDMGVLTWILASGRAIPRNYLHVIPNYTLLNWYQGTQQAYASYQGLITNAMDEAGGQGFATDYAGRVNDDLMQQLPRQEDYDAALAELRGADDARGFLSSLIFGFVFPQDTITEILQRQLPLSDGIDPFVYNDPTLLLEAAGTDAVDGARSQIVAEIDEGLVQPLANTLEVFDNMPYMTRMYTTLSAEEMTLDPIFSYNVDMPDQPMAREATLQINCNMITGESWSLTLGPGTERDGERVLEGTGNPPFNAPAIDQPTVLRAEFLNESLPADVRIDNNPGIFQIGDPRSCGAGAGLFASLSLVGLTLGMVALRRRR